MKVHLNIRYLCAVVHLRPDGIWKVDDENNYVLDLTNFNTSFNLEFKIRL